MCLVGPSSNLTKYPSNNLLKSAMNNFVDPSVSGIVGRDTLPALVWDLDVSPSFSGGQPQEPDVLPGG